MKLNRVRVIKSGVVLGIVVVIVVEVFVGAKVIRVYPFKKVKFQKTIKKIIQER